MDVAGYSRRTEADEAASIQAVSALRQQVARAASAHGGRVFNAAGDGFMLEFPTASGALAAAEEIATSGDPPVRVGVHLGEVSLTESGDSLGHGVNVAARIQQMANPGAVLASGDVKRAVRGPLGERLKPQGSVRPDKMSEMLSVFALAPADGGHTRGRRREFKAGPLSLVLLLAATLALAGWWLAKSLSPATPREPRVAILPFRTLGGDADLRSFADGLTDEIQGVLSSNQFLTVSASESEALRGAGASNAVARLGVVLLLDGVVEREGSTIRVRVHLDDPRQHATLWSNEFEGPASGADALQAAVAARTTDVTHWGLIGLTSGRGMIDEAGLSAFIQGSDELSNSDEAGVRTLEKLTAAAPSFALAHSRLSVALMVSIRNVSADQQAATVMRAAQEARRSMALDPNNGEAYLGLQTTLPTVAWRQREALLQKGVSVDPSSPYVNYFLSKLWAQAGRNRDALAAARRAAALNPVFSSMGWILADRLAGAGLREEAVAVEARDRRLFGAEWMLRNLLLIDALASPAEGLATLQDPAKRPPLSVSEAAVWKAVLKAKQHPSAAATAPAVRRIEQLEATGRADPRLVIIWLALAGDRDAAFQRADRYYSPAWLSQPSGAATPWETAFLFEPATGLRDDPRMMALAARLGLVDYWRSTGKWPDFCAGPGLPYDCRTEGAKAVAALHER